MRSRTKPAPAPVKPQYYKPRDLKRVGDSLFSAGFVSLCAGGGIGDLGIEHSSAGLKLAVAVERDPRRARILQGNYPRARVVQGDMSKRATKAQVDVAVREAFGPRKPFAVIMTPPCQGWSPSGQGRLKKNGHWHPESDDRNLVVSHCVEVVKRILPAWVVFENVPHVRAKKIRLRKRLTPVVEYIKNRLRKMGYSVHESPRGMNAAKYGIPQNRTRIFLVAERFGLPDGLVFPPALRGSPRSGSKNPGLPPCVTLGETIGPSSPRGKALMGRLSASDPSRLQDPDDPYHRISTPNPQHLAWMERVPEGGTAFDNKECPACHFSDPQYRWQSDAACKRCGALLVKPLTNRDGRPQVIKGRRTSYRRMRWNRPAPTITCNSDTVSSDTKVHPSENRVLSLREVMILQTVEAYPYRWEASRDPYWQLRKAPSGSAKLAFSDTFLRDIIGEAIPPLWLQIIFDNLWALDEQCRRPVPARDKKRGTDIFTPAKRSAIMRAIPSKNTKFETGFRHLMRRRGARGYRLHWKPAASADLAWPGLKVAVFLDSDFWHGWNWRRLRPKLKNRFWVEKISKTMQRDANATKRLRADGWIVVRLWGHEIEDDPEGCVTRIIAAVEKRRGERRAPSPRVAPLDGARALSGVTPPNSQRPQAIPVVRE